MAAGPIDAGPPAAQPVAVDPSKRTAAIHWAGPRVVVTTLGRQRPSAGSIRPASRCRCRCTTSAPPRRARSSSSPRAVDTEAAAGTARSPVRNPTCASTTTRASASTSSRRRSRSPAHRAGSGGSPSTIARRRLLVSSTSQSSTRETGPFVVDERDHVSWAAKWGRVPGGRGGGSSTRSTSSQGVAHHHLSIPAADAQHPAVTRRPAHLSGCQPVFPADSPAWSSAISTIDCTTGDVRTASMRD